MKAIKRKTLKERRIDTAPLVFRIDEESRRLKREPEWSSGKEDGITLVKYPHMRIVLVALKNNTSMHEHKVKGPISLFVMSGKVTLLVDKNEFILKKNGLFSLRKSILHEVHADENSVIMLTIMAI